MRSAAPSGNSRRSAGSGCYTIPIETDYGTNTTTVNTTCGAPYTNGPNPTGNTIGGGATYSWNCSNWHTWIGWINSCPSSCTAVISSESVTKCNHCGSTSCNGKHITSYNISCGKTETTIESQYTKFE